MTRFLLGRCLGLVLTLLAASAVVFLVLDVLPGDVAQVMLGPDADPQAVQALAAQLGLDRPAWVRYGQWLLGLLQGELGMSQAYGVPVAGLLAERLVLTVPLTLLAMGLAGGMALLAGVYAALHHRRWGDVGLMALAQLGMATPGKSTMLRSGRMGSVSPTLSIPSEKSSSLSQSISMGITAPIDSSMSCVSDMYNLSLAFLLILVLFFPVKMAGKDNAVPRSRPERRPII